MKSRRRRRRRFTAEEKADFAERARALRAEGRTWTEVCDELGVLMNSLKLWMAQHPARPAPKAKPQRRSPRTKAKPRPKRRPRLAEVQVLEPASPGASSATIVLTTPSGHKVSGLTIEAAAALLERIK